MKVILTSTDLVFRREKEWVNKPLVYGSFNSNNGAATIPSDSQYKRSCVGEKISVETDGVNIIPMIGEGASSSVYVYMYDANNSFIGVAKNDSDTAVSNGNEYSIFEYLTNYKDPSGTDMDKDTAIAATKSYYLAFKSFVDNTGLYVRIR